MNVELRRAAFDDKSVVRELLNLYLYELSDLAGADVDAHGRFEYRYLDHYWTDERRHPFLIAADGALAGMALVNDHTATGAQYCIAEFFVTKHRRRRGVGSAAARAAFEMLLGPWEVCTDRDNEAAARFWRATVHAYTGGAFAEYDGFGEWTGPVFTFTSGGR
ncbi:MAG TPA: GNAT family N-acetyltransferase [Actinomycetota bacterium]|nr:GNAT family N-acetyltransferase [Actinomycetota bacterium]